MYKIVLLSVFSLPLFAGFFPSTVHTSVQSVNDTSIMLQKPFMHNGMTAVVVHSYDKTLHAINSRLTQTGLDGTSILISADIIHHDELPTVKTTVRKGDKVIGGYLYNNVLVLAPDADTYARVTKSYNKKWIHPDLFALYLSVEGEGRATKANLLHFAKKYQVGLIYIVHKDSEVLLDPISGVVIAKKARIGSVSQGKFPFYMRFDSIESGWFGGSETGNYYQAVGAL
ncbi:MAG: plasminogen-binding N-terminal domain-containing protein [Sulfurovum sp.]|nr:plasminogen-binding N-terminal domain-containing protein [Sulfurovum sp.]